MAAMARDEIHPDLRRTALLVPRRTVYPWSVPLLQLIPVRRPAREGEVEILTLPSGTGVRLYRPAGLTGDTPALLWMHGGGYMLGGPEQDDALCRRYVERLGIAVAAVRYRLAPKHPYPAALEDCSCQVREVPGAFHGFDVIAPKSGVALSCFDSTCAALRGALALAG